jgi:hypothetical protein
MTSDDLERASADTEREFSGERVGATTTECGARAAHAPAVSVTIVPFGTEPACPGRPLELRAVGDPLGGTYRWRVSGNAQLVNAAGSPATNETRVFMRCFKPSHKTGNIPERKVSVRVTYTHPNGTARASKRITVHAIRFLTTNVRINRRRLHSRANETAVGVRVGQAVGGNPTMSTDPRVRIRLHPSCPRKADCARNHRIGWIQTIYNDVRRRRYTHTRDAIIVAPPLYDAVPGAIVPFYGGTNTFAGDGDVQTSHHEDSPYTSPGWTDPRAGAPAPPPAVNRQLRRILFGMRFTAWLVVQNMEWMAHDRDHSFAYIRNFNWWFNFPISVTTANAVGSRCSPASMRWRRSRLRRGKGGRTPALAPPIFNNEVNDPANRHINPAPAI